MIDEGSVFFAIAGDRHDGHLFLQALYQLGIRQFIVERDVPEGSFPGSNILKVRSTVEALQKIASIHRSQFSLPVIGITGSNGKTIVKEWLYQVLAPDLKIVKNPGSYNSQVGVPVSVWQINKHHDLGIFEAGISQPNEMAKLQSVIQPSIGIFTNIGSAHDEGFASREEKAEEKAKLFSDCDTVIYCRDHGLIHETLVRTGRSFLTWGTSPKADINITSSGNSIFEISYQSKIFSLHLPFHDPASRENAFHVMAFMLYKDYDASVIQDRIQSLQSVPMRLELKQGINRCIIIDDSYNNDLAGLRISLDFLKNQQKVKKTLILSDVLQSGLSEAELIKEIKGLITAGQVKKLIGIGPVLFNNQKFFSGTFFRSTAEFSKAFKLTLLQMMSS
ncbi:MAG: Mur ligase family protein [Bacteroidota bacterium]